MIVNGLNAPVIHVEGIVTNPEASSLDSPAAALSMNQLQQFDATTSQGVMGRAFPEPMRPLSDPDMGFFHAPVEQHQQQDLKRPGVGGR